MVLGTIEGQQPAVRPRAIVVAHTRASAPWANHAIYSLAETDLLQPLRVWKPHRVAILLFIIDIISEEKDWESGKKACH